MRAGRGRWGVHGTPLSPAGEPRGRIGYVKTTTADRVPELTAGRTGGDYLRVGDPRAVGGSWASIARL